MAHASDPVEEHGPILFKDVIFNIPLQVKTNAVVALLSHPITEENGTGEMLDGQIRRRDSGPQGLRVQIFLGFREPVPGMEQRLLALGPGGLHLAKQVAFKAIIDILQAAHLSG